MKRLLIRGGGIAAGVGTTVSYASMISWELAKDGIEVVNRSRKGETSFDALRTYLDDIEPLRPDMLLLHFGVDDMYHPVYRSEFKENLVQLIRLARERFDPRILLLTSQTFSEPSVMDAASIYYRAIREVSMDLRCGYIPVHLWWMSYPASGSGDAGALFDECETYPNERGHGIIASAVVQKIRRLSILSESSQ